MWEPSVPPPRHTCPATCPARTAGTRHTCSFPVRTAVRAPRPRCRARSRPEAIPPARRIDNSDDCRRSLSSGHSKGASPRAVTNRRWEEGDGRSHTSPIHGHDQCRGARATPTRPRGAARPVRGRARGALGSGAIGGRSRHRPHNHRRERPAVVPLASSPHVPAGGRCLPADQGGRPLGLVDPVHHRAPDAARSRYAHRTGRVSTGRPNRSPTCWRTPTTAPTTSRGWPGSGPPWVRPMLLDDEVVGGLLVWRNEVNPFDEREKTIVSAFAVQAAMAMNRVKLVQQLESRSGELARKVEELEALREVGEAVSSSLDVDNVLATIAKHAVELSGTDGGSIMEYAEQDRSFTVRSVYRTEPSVVERLRTIRIDLDETLVGLAARQRRPIAVTDLDAHDLDPHLPDPLRRRLAVGGGGPDAARRADRRRTRRTPQADGRLLGGDPRPAGDLCQPVGDRPAQRPAVPRAEGAELRARAGQPAQVRVPGKHVPRAADAAQRGPGLLRGAPRADVRRHQRAAGGVPPRHPRVGQAPAGAAQRDPRPVEGRGRSDGARVLLVRPALGAGGDRLDAARTSRPRTASTCGSRWRTRSPRSTPTSCGSSRSCSTS